ncbi:hypothetical protein PybrP1_010169 [[Pythium] brassicae (nom. inval.)]|nr:hypothetical protein PybrP1_010169 [[Pythium] brassicae (nom. inval.)]
MASPATRSQPSAAEAKAPPVLVEDPGASSFRALDGKGLTIAIVYSRWYGKAVVDPLVKACADELLEKGVEAPHLLRVEVSGAYEIPFAASRLIQTKHGQLDAVVCIGCMVKGATMAYEFVSEAVTMAIMKLNVMTDTPVIFGVLTCTSENQAKQCAADIGGCGGSAKKCNHGVEWAQSALEMAHLKRSTAKQIATKCLCKCHCASEHCRCACHCVECACKTCTCADCTCASCAGSKVHSAKPVRCTGCGRSGASCHCVACNCSACRQKHAA